MKTTIVALLLICITSFAFSDDTQIIINKPKGYGIERNLSESTKATVYMSEDNKTIISVTHEQYDLKGQNKKNLPDDLFLDIIAYKYVRTNFGKTLSGKDINSFSIDSSAKLYNAVSIV